MSAYFQTIGTNNPGTSWNSRAGVSLKARFTERNKKKLTFVTVPVGRSDVPVVVASYCLPAYGPLLHVRIRMPSNCSCFIDEDRLTTARETNQYLHWNRTESEDTSTCDRNSVVLLFLGVHHCTDLGEMVPPKNHTLRPLEPSRTPVGPR